MTRIFGNPGSNELPFLFELPESIEYVLGLHEGVVVGMADGWSQVTGRVGFCNLHAASGTGNAMGALTNARYSRTPLVITAGQQVRSVIGMQGMLANIDAPSLARPLVDWAMEPSCPQDVPRALAEALFTAEAQRTPTYLSVPYDDWDAAADDNTVHLTGRRLDVAGTPDHAQLSAVVDAIVHAERPALVLGGDIDAAGSFDRAVAAAEAVDCPVWAAPSLFRLPFPNRHRLFRGVLPAGVAPIGEALAEHDVVAVLGAPIFRYHQHVPGTMLAAGTRILQVTTDVSAAARAPMGETLVADPGAVLVALAARGRPEPSEYIACPDPTTTGGKTHPEEVFDVLRRRNPADAVYVVESTSTNSSFWNQMDLRHPGSYFFPASGGLGFGLPAAVGVALGHRDLGTGRRVTAVIGDGSANYALPALWSAVQLDVDLDIVILRNNTYGALRWFADLLDVGEVPGMDVPGIDFTGIAQGYGLPATHLPDAAALDDAWSVRDSGPRLFQIDTALTQP